MPGARVSIAEIERLLSDRPRIAPDLAHSNQEDRFIAVGRNAAGRAIFVAFTIRTRDGQGLIRPISARFMHRKESNAYARKVPKLATDDEAERFLAQDLSDLDFSQFKPVRFEFEPKSERVNMRLPKPLLEAVKASAAAEGIPYQRFIRQTLERALSGKSAT